MYLVRPLLVILTATLLGCSPAEEPSEPVRETIAIEYVGEPELHIHQAPDAASPVVTTYKQGETVSIVAKRDGWAEIRLVNGTGWVPEESLSTEMKSADESEGASTTVRFKDAPSPVYSQSRTRGEIILEGTVNTAGIVTNIKTIRNTTGSESLERQNRAEFAQATFYPLLVKGKRVEFIYEYRIEY